MSDLFVPSNTGLKPQKIAHKAHTLAHGIGPLTSNIHVNSTTFYGFADILS